MIRVVLLRIFLAVLMGGNLAAEQQKEDDLDGKVTWPQEYHLEILKPRIDISEGKNYLAGVVQNLVNDELFLQRTAITRGNILPLKIEYSVQKDHEDLPADERKALLNRFRKPAVLPLKIVRLSETVEGNFSCDKARKVNAYTIFTRVTGALTRLKLEVTLCQGTETLIRQSTAADEQELVAAITRLMNPVRAKLTGDKYASLHIESVPPRASVYIDDQFLGKTPLKYSYLIPGKYNLTIKKDNFETVSEVILPATNETVRRNIDLSSAKAVGTINVTSDPPGAKIYLDADYKGVTPNKLEKIAPGTYRLHLLHPGKGEAFKTITLSEENKSIEVNERLHDFLANKKPGLLGVSYKTWYWVSLGISAASLGSAIGYYVWRDEAQEDIFGRISAKTASQYTSDDIAFIAERKSAYNTRQDFATGFMVSAGLFAAISIWFYIEHLFAADDSIVMKEPKRKTENVEVRLGGRSGGGDLSVELRF